MRLTDRRRFLHDTAALAAAIVALPPGSSRAGDNADPEPAAADAKTVSANEILRVAVVGVHGRGMDHIEGFGRLKDVRITAICDIDHNVIGSAKQSHRAALRGTSPKYVPGHRRVLDDKRSTPFGRHAQPLARAGHDLGLPGRQGRLRREARQPQRFGGRRMVEAARKYGRIVQTGTQCRSHQGIQDAVVSPLG